MNTGLAPFFTRGFRVGLGFVLFMAVSAAFWAEVQPSAAHAADGKGAMSADELNRQLNFRGTKAQ